jgi:hypothetical protein
MLLFNTTMRSLIKKTAAWGSSDAQQVDKSQPEDDVGAGRGKECRCRETAVVKRKPVRVGKQKRGRS